MIRIKNPTVFFILMKLSKHEHYFTRQQTSKKKEYGFVENVLGVPLKLMTTSGIFSPRQIDLGTLILIKYMVIHSGNNVLDFGCGYGAIGIMAAKLYNKCNVVMVDINERAVECAKENVFLNRIHNAHVKQSFFYSTLKDEFFDVILSNLPMSAGLDTCYKIIEGAKTHLVTNGTLQVVSRQRKGGVRIMAKMEEVFGNVEVLARKGGYWVYCSKNI